MTHGHKSASQPLTAFDEPDRSFSENGGGRRKKPIDVDSYLDPWDAPGTRRENCLDGRPPLDMDSRIIM